MRLRSHLIDWDDGPTSVSIWCVELIEVFDFDCSIDNVYLVECEYIGRRHKIAFLTVAYATDESVSFVWQNPIDPTGACVVDGIPWNHGPEMPRNFRMRQIQTWDDLKYSLAQAVT